MKRTTLSPIWEAFKIIGWIAAPFFLINQLQQLQLKEDPISKTLRKTQYVLQVTRNNKKYSYIFTHDDILNFMRSIYKEGKQEPAVAWTLISRFALLYPETYNNFTNFLKSYVQPISPAWFPNGSKFKASLAYVSDQNLALERAKERIVNSKLPLNQIPDFEKELVLKILEGKVLNPVPSAVHYITSQANDDDSEEIARQKQLKFAQERMDLFAPVFYESSRKRNNWFFSSKSSKNLNFKIITKHII